MRRIYPGDLGGNSEQGAQTPRLRRMRLAMHSVEQPCQHGLGVRGLARLDEELHGRDIGRNIAPRAGRERLP